jgi:hypothetical protein
MKKKRAVEAMHYNLLEEIDEEEFDNDDDREDAREEVEEPFWYEHIRSYLEHVNKLSVVNESVQCRRNADGSQSKTCAEIWGYNWVADIDNPGEGVVDDYNHWMGGCDKAYQMISYYRPRLRCRRNMDAYVLALPGRIKSKWVCDLKEERRSNVSKGLCPWMDKGIE